MYQCLETDRLLDPVVPFLGVSLPLSHDLYSDRSRRERCAGPPLLVTTEWSVVLTGFGLRCCSDSASLLFKALFREGILYDSLRRRGFKLVIVEWSGNG
jgi:hypothetical protein